jgi:hypothetical protein
MRFESFEYLISKLKDQGEADHRFYALGLDLQNIVDPFHHIISHLLKVYYGEEGENWISWFLYERSDSEEAQAWDRDGNEICYDVKSLWAYVEEIRVSSDFEEYVPPKEKTKEEIEENIKQIFKKFNSDGIS